MVGMVPRCDDGDDVHHGDARGGVPAYLGEARHHHRARDGETTPATHVVTLRYGGRNPSTTPSPVDTGSGPSDFLNVPSFSPIFFFLSSRLFVSQFFSPLKANDHNRIQNRKCKLSDHK